MFKLAFSWLRVRFKPVLEKRRIWRVRTEDHCGKLSACLHLLIRRGTVV